VPGEYFFPGLRDARWRHQRECIRLNFARPKREIDEGFTILAEEVRRAYAESSSPDYRYRYSNAPVPQS